MTDGKSDLRKQFHIKQLMLVVLVVASGLGFARMIEHKFANDSFGTTAIIFTHGALLCFLWRALVGMARRFEHARDPSDKIEARLDVLALFLTIAMLLVYSLSLLLGE